MSGHFWIHVALMFGAICGWELVKWLERHHKEKQLTHDEILYRATRQRTTVGGQAINDRLWKFECGCYEGFRPYHFYPCAEHRTRARALFIGVRQQ